jgi:hypothetical protein
VLSAWGSREYLPKHVTIAELPKTNAGDPTMPPDGRMSGMDI